MQTEARRWSREYRQRLVREEVTSLERVQDLGALETLVLRLPELVGSRGSTPASGSPPSAPRESAR